MFDKREVRCTNPDCGALNRVREHSFRQIPNCGSCHTALPESAATRLFRNIYTRRKYFGWPLYLAILASPIAFFAWLGSGPNDVTARETVKCAAQPRPPMGDYLITDFGDRIAPFEVSTESGIDYLVKLERANNRTSAFWFFVIGGQNFETQVPLGTYSLKYLAGKIWCGRSLYFGNKLAERGRTLLTFTEATERVEGHSVTLYRVPHGNFATETISKDVF